MPEPESEEFRRFREMTRRLIAVPPQELEQKRREYEVQKARRRAARKKKPA